MEQAIKNETIIDVRSEQEFAMAHLHGSINIPLQELPDRMDEIKKMKNIVLCCASGARSAAATQYLLQQNISCANGGPWNNLKQTT